MNKSQSQQILDLAESLNMDFNTFMDYLEKYHAFPFMFGGPLAEKCKQALEILKED